MVPLVLGFWIGWGVTCLIAGRVLDAEIPAILSIGALLGWLTTKVKETE